MGVELFKHNAIAYEKVTEMFETENRACVVHPTGCGKSFISLKWLEENRDKRAIYLAPTVSILRQITKHIESCGMSMKDFPFLKRYTYSKLSKMTDEEISKLDVDMIVLDEFHRCGASEWSRGIATLINNNNTAKVLGFSATPIRYLDEHRDMAEELFHGNVASEITLEEALVNGILPIPTYINAVYSFKDDIQNMQERINRERRETERLQAQQYLDDAKKILEKADGLPEIFQKHIKNRAGKYIVFCRNKEHMQKMMEESKTWFQGVNEQIDRYSMASFIPKSENLKVFEDFYHSNNDHLKLLFSIDMLNEGIHVPNIDGVIMLRPTESPIIFKQQLGRALSVGHNANPLVFDIVNNVQSCEMINHFYTDLRERALVKFTQTGNKEDEAKIEAFQISDTVRQIQDIFSKIDNCLSLSWDDYYELAVEYYKEHGNLLVPSNYSKNGMNLGSWIGTQRQSIKAKGDRKPLSTEQIERLNAIGMVWNTLEEQWNLSYEKVEKFKKENGRFPAEEADDEEEAFLGRWIGTQKQRILRQYADKKEDEIPVDKRIKIDKLHQIGIIYKIKSWEEWYEEYKNFLLMHDGKKPYQKSKNGTEAALGRWGTAQQQKILRKYYNVTEESIPDEIKDKIKKLHELGIFHSESNRQSWEETYEEVIKFLQENGRLPYSTSSDSEESRLGRWKDYQKDRIVKAYRHCQEDEIPKKIKEKLKLLSSFGEEYMNATTNEEKKDRFDEYVEFLKEHNGKTPSNKSKDKRERTLSRWALEERRWLQQFENVPIDTLSEQDRERIEKIRTMLGEKIKRTWEEWLEEVISFRENQGRWPSQNNDEKPLNTWIVRQRQLIRKWSNVPEENIPDDIKEKLKMLNEAGIVVKISQEKQTDILAQEDRTEESLEELETRLQGLVQKKKASSKLVKDFERVKKSKSANKGVEK